MLLKFWFWLPSPVELTRSLKALLWRDSRWNLLMAAQTQGTLISLASFLDLTTAIISSSFFPVSPEQWRGWGPSCCWELLSDVSEATLSTCTLRWRSNPFPQCRESRCLTCSRQTWQPSFRRQRPPCLSALTVLSPLSTTKVSSVWLCWVSKERKNGWRQARDKWREIQRQQETKKGREIEGKVNGKFKH